MSVCVCMSPACRPSGPLPGSSDAHLPLARLHGLAALSSAEPSLDPLPGARRFARQSQPREVTPEFERGPLIFFDALL